MPSIYDIKPKFQAVLRPMSDGLARIGVTANQVTIIAALLSIAVGALMYWQHDRRVILWVLPATLLLRMALNAIDGMLAREHDMKSNLGGMLNEVGDVVSDSALYLPLAIMPWFDAATIVIVTLLAVISELAGVVGVQIGGSRRYDGPMGKSDRALVFGVLAIVVACGVPGGWWFDAAVWIVAALTGVTIVNRARLAVREADASVAGQDVDESNPT